MTQKPLEQMIPELLTHLQTYMSYLEYNERIFKVLEGQLRYEVEQSLKKEVISKAAYKRIVERIPSINVLQKTTKQLSKVYVEAPNRITDKKSDQDIMNDISRSTSIDSQMTVANFIYNGLHSVAIEPYVDNGRHALRVLSPHQFLPYSDDPRDPMKMTVFMKFLGTEKKEREPNIDSQGYDRRRRYRPRMVTIIAAYSDNEILVFDTDGQIRVDKMMQLGLDGVNPFGRIPFVYKSKSSFELVPPPNQGGLDMAVLVPKLLADLNYAAQYMSHSIVWARNADLNGQELNPDAVVDLGDQVGEGGVPELGLIQPTVDIDGVLTLINYQLTNHFSTLGIKVQDTGLLSNGRDSSGIAKAIDASDISEQRKEQIEVFRCIEKWLWSLLQVMQSEWARSNVVEINRAFSPSFIDSFRIKYAEVKPLKSNMQKLEEIQLMREQKLMTRRQALRLLNPDFSEAQLDAWVEELKDESEEDMMNMLAGMPTSMSDTKSDGTFQVGNQVGAKQTPESRPNEDKN